MTPLEPPVARRDLGSDEEAVMAAFGALKWVIIGSLVVGLVIAGWFAVNWVQDFRDENCDSGESWVNCMARNSISGTLEVLKDALVGGTVGAGSTLFGWGKNIGEATTSEAVSGKRWWNPWTWGT